MREALRIFRKDVRRLRWEICVLTVLVAWLAVFDSQFASNARRGGTFTLLELVVSFSSWFLIVLAILEEKLAGERAYWLTQPIHRTSLLIAKLLFIGSFVVLPTLLAQVATLLGRGLSPWAYRSGLISNHVALAASLMVIAAVASVVANVSLFVSALLGGVAIAVLGGLGANWLLSRLPRLSVAGPVDASSASYFVVCLVGVAAAAIMVFHYASRRTAAARMSLMALGVFQGAAILLAMSGSSVVGRFMPVSESPFPGGPPALSFDPAREPATETSRPRRINQVHIPIRIEGLPPGMLAASETIDYRFSLPGI